MKRYEAMFLFDNAAAHEWPAVEKEVNRLTSRIGASLLACVKFDERKLAYEIRGRKRGTYVLTYMDAAPEKIGEFERDAQLSEAVLRVLVLRADDLSEERLTELRALPADKPLQPLATETRRDDRGGYRDRDGGGYRDRDGGGYRDRDGGGGGYRDRGPGGGGFRRREAEGGGGDEGGDAGGGEE